MSTPSAKKDNILERLFSKIGLSRLVGYIIFSIICLVVVAIPTTYFLLKNFTDVFTRGPNGGSSQKPNNGGSPGHTSSTTKPSGPKIQISRPSPAGTKGGAAAASGGKKIKLLVVGDGGVGKTSLLESFFSGSFPDEYVPTVFDNNMVDFVADGKPITLDLRDSMGQDAYDRFRRNDYPETDVFLIAFSVGSHPSFENVTEKWISEITDYAPPNTPIILVGTKIDLRKDINTINKLKGKGKAPIDAEQGENKAREIKANGYVECSAKELKDLNEVFFEAIRAVPGIQQPGGTGNQQPGGTGNQQPGGTGNQQPGGTGNQQQGGTGNQQQMNVG